MLSFKSDSWACPPKVDSLGKKDCPELSMSRQTILGHFPKAGPHNILPSSKKGSSDGVPEDCSLLSAFSAPPSPGHFHPADFILLKFQGHPIPSYGTAGR